MSFLFLYHCKSIIFNLVFHVVLHIIFSLLFFLYICSFSLLKSADQEKLWVFADLVLTCNFSIFIFQTCTFKGSLWHKRHFMHNFWEPALNFRCQIALCPCHSVRYWAVLPNMSWGYIQRTHFESDPYPSSTMATPPSTPRKFNINSNRFKFLTIYCHLACKFVTLLYDSWYN